MTTQLTPYTWPEVDRRRLQREPTMFDPQAVYAALNVIARTPHIAAYLAQNDPKAWEQARRALGI